MRSRNYNLELGLLPFIADSDPQYVEEESSSLSNGDRHHQQQQQKLTIFYNGRVCVCDVTELRAREILSLAGRESEETMRTPTSSMAVSSSSPVPLSTTTITNLSMKRSLQSFLQKRKNRIRSRLP